jgi:hypothetical protein
MAKSLEGCLNGVANFLKLTKKYPSITFHVYTNRNKMDGVYDSSYLTKHRLVYDAHKTGEVWATEPLELDKVGTFDLRKGHINWKSAHSVRPFGDENEEPYEEMTHYEYINLPEINHER